MLPFKNQINCINFELSENLYGGGTLKESHCGIYLFVMLEEHLGKYVVGSVLISIANCNGSQALLMQTIKEIE